MTVIDADLVLYKSRPVTVKAAPDGTGTAGEFEAIVSVFGNVDHMGDVVVPGAFVDTIAEWKSSGDTLPVLWSHRADDPQYNIGSVVDIAELAAGDVRIPAWADPWVADNGGLWVKGLLDVGNDASPIAVQARRLLVARRVTQFSFAYDIVDGGAVTVDGEPAYELRKLRLHEISPTQFGANNRTELIGAKGGTRSGERGPSVRVQASIRDAIKLLAAELTQHDGSTPDGEPVKVREEPPGVKRTEEPAGLDVASTRLLTDLTAAELSVTD